MADQHIFNLANTLTKPIFKNQSDYFIKIIQIWQEVTPLAWKNKVIPISLKWNTDREATLIVKANSPGLALTLSYDTTLVIKKINTYFGHKVIVKINFSKI